MAAPSRTHLTVVVPTYEEADNIKPLCTRLFKACRAAKLTVELLLVDDDSGAGTEATERVVAVLQKDAYDIRMHIRRRHEGRGLSSAVVLGIEKATHPTVLCMDADLQHEPESVPAATSEISLTMNVNCGRLRCPSRLCRIVPPPPCSHCCHL